MNIVAITFGDINCASSYYRIYQYRDYLENRGINLSIIPADEFREWEKIRSYDLVIIQKRLFSTFKVRKIRKLAGKLIYDIDDAIWEPHGREHHWFTRWRTNRRLKYVVGQADLCICANRYIENHISPLAKRCEIIPMSLDETKWTLEEKFRAQKYVVNIGWIGSPSNLPFFTAIEPALFEIQRRHRNVEFTVFSGERPRLRQLQIKYVPFDPEKEIEIVSGFDIGLLPLDTSPFANGKSPIKALKYMACGVPCVATPTSSVLEIFKEKDCALFARNDEEWINSIELLINSPEKRDAIGKRARSEFEKRFTLSKNGEILADLLRHV